MDPNATLARMRKLYADMADRWEKHPGGAQYDREDADDRAEIAELAMELDRWISSGGFLPEAWTKSTPGPARRPRC